MSAAPPLGRILYVDCETDRTLAEAGYAEEPMFARSANERKYERSAAVQKMMVTLCVTRWSNETSTRVHAPQAAPRGAVELVSLLDQADAICAWNAGHVVGLLAKYLPAGRVLDSVQWRDKSIDPMVQLAHAVSGQFQTLSSVAASDDVSGRGDEAVALHAQGRTQELSRCLERDLGLLQGLCVSLLGGGTVKVPVGAALRPGAWQRPPARTVSTQTTTQATVRRA